MKALSLRQPYAELIVSGKKIIELRRWNTKHRGIFLVHASQYHPALSEVEPFGLTLDDLDFGAIIGSVELIDVKNYDDLPDNEWEKDSKYHLAGLDYKYSTKGFLLKNAKRFKKPFLYKGQLNFFEVPDELIK